MVANVFFFRKKYEAKICFAEHAEKFIRDNTSGNYWFLSFYVFDVTIQSVVLIF